MMAMPRIVPDADGLIACRSCPGRYPPSEFTRTKRSGIDRRCKACSRLRNNERNATTAGKERLRKRYELRRADPVLRAAYNARSRQYSAERVTVERRMWESAKARAAKKGLPFTIAITDVVVPTCCPLLN